MNKRRLLFFAMMGLGAVGMGQQTPPIQPKTVDTPKLSPLVTPPLPTGSQIIANSPLTAIEAARIAIAHQPQVAISKAAADSLNGQRIQTQALLNPTVTVTAGATRVNQFVNGNAGTIGGPTSDYTSEIVLNQLLFDFDRTRDQVRQAQALEQAGYRSYDQTLQDVALQAKQDFYAYVQAQQQSKVQEANVQSRQAQVDLTQAQVSAGTGEPQDLVNAKTLQAQGVLLWSQALQAEATAKTKLTTDMGIDPRTPIKVTESSESNVTLPTDLNSLVDQGLKLRPTILSAMASLRAAGYGVSVARKTDAPSVGFQAGYDTVGPDQPFSNQTGFISVTLNWSLIDGGVKLGKVREAQANQSSAAASLRQASLGVIQDVSNALISVQAARQQIPVANAEVTDAQEGVRIALGSYKAGVTTFQTVITAQAALVQAQTDQVNSTAALNNALAALDHAIGKWPVS